MDKKQQLKDALGSENYETFSEFMKGKNKEISIENALKLTQEELLECFNDDEDIVTVSKNRFGIYFIKKRNILFF